jgi:hypothetical protein
MGGVELHHRAKGELVSAIRGGDLRTRIVQGDHRLGVHLIADGLDVGVGAGLQILDLLLQLLVALLQRVQARRERQGQLRADAAVGLARRGGDGLGHRRRRDAAKQARQARGSNNRMRKRFHFLSPSLVGGN